MVVIATDAHKSSLTGAGVDRVTGERRGGETVAATTAGVDRLLGWARRLDDERVWAVEDCRHVSGRFEGLLIGVAPLVGAAILAFRLRQVVHRLLERHELRDVVRVGETFVIGIGFFVLGAVLVASSPRYREFFGRRPEVASPGLPPRDVVEGVP